MRKLFLLIPILLTAAALVGGCVQPSPPEVKLQNYSISRVTLEGIEVNFNLEINNPNPVPMEIAGYSYQVFINDIEFLNEKRTGFSLPASDKKIVTIPVNIRYDKLFGTAASVIGTITSGGKTINYRIEGTVNAGLLGLNVAAPIKASGAIPIPKEIKY